jgi:hypothetical protein
MDWAKIAIDGVERWYRWDGAAWRPKKDAQGRDEYPCLRSPNEETGMTWWQRGLGDNAERIDPDRVTFPA